MSFDVYLACWRDGEESSLDRSAFNRRFEAHVVEARPGFARLAFADGGSDVYLADGERLHSITFNRPGGEAFFDALVTLAVDTGCAVYWAEEPPNLALPHAGIADHLPPDMLEALGPPVLVNTGRELIAAIEAS